MEIHDGLAETKAAAPDHAGDESLSLGVYGNQKEGLIIHFSPGGPLSEGRTKTADPFTITFE